MLKYYFKQFSNTINKAWIRLCTSSISKSSTSTLRLGNHCTLIFNPSIVCNMSDKYFSKSYASYSYST